MSEDGSVGWDDGMSVFVGASSGLYTSISKRESGP